MLLSLEEIDNGVAVAPGDDAEMSASERRRVLLALDARLAALAAKLAMRPASRDARPSESRRGSIP